VLDQALETGVNLEGIRRLRSGLVQSAISKSGAWKHGRPLLAALAGFALTVSAQSQPHYRIDPGMSEVHFTLGASDHPVEGTFHVTSGDFTLDPQSGAMTGIVSVDASSGQSGNQSRDKKMTKDQLKVQTYPTVTFAPARFSGQIKDSGDSSGPVEGTFTLLGQAHPITVPMNVHMESDRFSATGSFSVPFVSWGVKDPSFMFMKVDKEVKIDLKLTGTVAR
jgi:polyisoprenoid-binding protein YceI